MSVDRLQVDSDGRLRHFLSIEGLNHGLLTVGVKPAAV